MVWPLYEKKELVTPAAIIAAAIGNREAPNILRLPIREAATEEIAALTRMKVVIERTAIIKTDE